MRATASTVHPDPAMFIDFFESLIERVLATSDMLVTAVAGFITVIGVFQLIIVGISVIIVLLTAYARPVKTRKQVAMILISVLAALVICCMTLFLYFKSLKGVV